MNDFFLADDLSGALDAGAAFHRVGRRVRIVLSDDAWASAQPGDVMAVTTETRNAEPAAAAMAVRRAMAAAQARGGRLLYKKIDSTLRGPVAAELEAMMEALPGIRILFAPANPRVGRTVVGGQLLVRGAPLAETEFGRDPACPVRTSSVRELLGPAATAEVTIPDALTQADLETAARHMDAAPGPWVAVGSGALALTVAERVPRGDAIQSPRAPAVPSSPILMIGGSAHSLNRTQAERLRSRHGVPVRVLSLADVAAEADDALATMREFGGVMLQLPPARTMPAVALRVILTAATRLIREAKIRRIFATGGETAFGLCQELRLKSLDLIEEIEPGLSLSIGYSPDGPVALAVKPGGFGDAESWVRAWTALRGIKHGG